MKRIHEEDLRVIAVLNNEELQDYLDIELMVLGVEGKKPLIDIPQKPKIETGEKILFDDGKYAFDEANKKHIPVDYRYTSGRYILFPRKEKLSVSEIYTTEQREIYDNSLKLWEKENNKKKDSNVTIEENNEKVGHVYEYIQNVHNQAVDSKCRYADYEIKKEKYLKLSDNNKEIAANYLKEFYGERFCKNAEEWKNSKEQILTTIPKPEREEES